MAIEVDFSRVSIAERMAIKHFADRFAGWWIDDLVEQIARLADEQRDMGKDDAEVLELMLGSDNHWNRKSG